jgi:hypothetical protein
MTKYLSLPFSLSLSLVLLACDEAAVDVSPGDELADAAELAPLAVLGAYETAEFDAPELYTRLAGVRVDATVELELPRANDEPWSLVLTRRGTFPEDFEIDLLHGEGQVFRQTFPMLHFQGHLAGDPSRPVSLVLSPDYIAASIHEDERQVILESAELHGVDAPNLLVTYRSDETRAVETGAARCGVAPSASPQDRTIGEIPPALTPRSACWKLEIRAHGDFEYYKASNYNSNAAAFYLGAVLADASTLYNVLNLDFVIPSGGISILTDPNHGLYYPKSLDAPTLLDQTTEFWNYFLPKHNRDIVLLYTGKDLKDDTIGIAWVGQVCKALNYSYGIAQHTPNPRLTVAHEIGHLLGADHSNSCGGGIMNSHQLPNQPYFTKCSIDQMHWHLWFNNACLTQGSCT